MFKGSTKFNKKKGTSIWSTLQKVGAQINATTSKGRTHYFATLPTKYLDLAMDIESDRSRNATFTQEDLDSEMTTIRNELERGENDPSSVLYKSLWATAYMAHPVRIPTIGWKSDVEAMTEEKLRTFYNTYYYPDNATVIVVGKFDKDEILQDIQHYFGSLKKAPKPISDLSTIEPEQQGLKTFTIQRAGQQRILSIGYKSPEATHPDAFAFQVLDSLCTNGKNSRFYKAFIETSQATNISMSSSLLRDPGLSTIFIYLTEETSDSIALETLDNELKNIVQNGVSDKEIQNAKDKIIAYTLLERDSSQEVMYGINEAVSMGDWTLYPTFIEKIQKVTPEDIVRVVKTYFKNEKKTIGTFIPLQKQITKQNDSKKEIVKDKNIGEGISNIELDSFEKHDFTSISKEININSKLENTLRIITVDTPVEGIVSIQGSFSINETPLSKKNRLLPILTAYMLEEGTKKHNKFQIAEELAASGTDGFSFSSDTYRVRFGTKTLSKYASKVMEFLGEQLMYPKFNEVDLDKLKKRLYTHLKTQKSNTNTMAILKLEQTIYPKNHPNYALDIDEELELLDSITIEQVREYYTSVYGLNETFTVVAVGDTKEIPFTNILESTFKSWKQIPLQQKEDVPSVVPTSTIQKVDVPIPDKSSSTLVIGQYIDMDEYNEDFIPLSVGIAVLGHDFSARLMQTVRDKYGLTYGIRAITAKTNDGYKGYMKIAGTFAPKLLRKGRTITLEQVIDWAKNGITEKELEDKKTTLIGLYHIGMEKTDGLCNRILDTLEQKRELSWLEEFPKRIHELTVEKVNNTIEKYIDTKKLIIVKAGTF